MTAARDDDFMALPGMETASTDTHHAQERLSDDCTSSSNASLNTSAKSALDAPLDKYRARAKSEREKGTLFNCHIVMDTSGAPWSDGFVKASHPRVRTNSQRRTYCRGIPIDPPINAQPARHN